MNCLIQRAATDTVWKPIEWILVEAVDKVFIRQQLHTAEEVEDVVLFNGIDFVISDAQRPPHFEESQHAERSR